MIGCDGAGCVVWQHQLCCYPDADEAFLRATKHFCEACKEKRSQEFQHIKEKEGHNLVLPVRNKEMANNPLKADMNCHGAQVPILALVDGEKLTGNRTMIKLQDLQINSHSLLRSLS